MDKVDRKRRRRVMKDIVLGRRIGANDAEFAEKSTVDIAERAPAVSLAAVGMLGLGLTQIHSFFPLTTATTWMLVLCSACLIAGAFFTIVNLRVWRWNKKRKTTALERDDNKLPNDFWDNPSQENLR